MFTGDTVLRSSALEFVVEQDSLFQAGFPELNWPVRSEATKAGPGIAPGAGRRDLVRVLPADVYSLGFAVRASVQRNRKRWKISSSRCMKKFSITALSQQFPSRDID
ncbi:hypothetical protein DBR22_15410 [Arthrobacter sp. HMWF013]|nr:hypothetical protein DBR22_15410 [Arthrobacter sp. HMWF013]